MVRAHAMEAASGSSPRYVYRRSLLVWLDMMGGTLVNMRSDLHVSAVCNMMGFVRQIWRLPVVHCEDVCRRSLLVWLDMMGGTLVNMRSDLYVAVVCNMMEFARQICSDVYFL